MPRPQDTADLSLSLPQGGPGGALLLLPLSPTAAILEIEADFSTELQRDKRGPKVVLAPRPEDRPALGSKKATS